MMYSRSALSTASLMAAATCLLTFVPARPAAAQQVVVPNGSVATEGNVGNRFPFLVNGGIRYQQVYNASQFSGPILITQIAFRPDGDGGTTAFSRTLSNINIALSTTSAAEGSLSLVFANNIGADNATVYSGALTLTSAFTGPVGGPKNFDIVINLQTPFAYNPAAGNLLMDVLNSSPENNDITMFFDATDNPSDGTQRVTGDEGAPTALVAPIQDPVGLVTRFTGGTVSSAAPEPGSLVLLTLMGLPLAGAVMRRRVV